MKGIKDKVIESFLRDFQWGQGYQSSPGWQTGQTPPQAITGQDPMTLPLSRENACLPGEAVDQLCHWLLFKTSCQAWGSLTRDVGRMSLPWYVACYWAPLESLFIGWKLPVWNFHAHSKITSKMLSMAKMAAKCIKKYVMYTCTFNNEVTQTGQLIVERWKSLGKWPLQ